MIYSAVEGIVQKYRNVTKKNKVEVILTDGQGGDMDWNAAEKRYVPSQRLRVKLEEARRLGIQIIGVGFGTQEVSVFDRYIQLDQNNVLSLVEILLKVAQQSSIGRPIPIGDLSKAYSSMIRRSIPTHIEMPINTYRAMPVTNIEFNQLTDADIQDIISTETTKNNEAGSEDSAMVVAGIIKRAIAVGVLGLVISDGFLSETELMGKNVPIQRLVGSSQVTRKFGRAMPKGGIDFNSDKMENILTVKNNGGGTIKFHIDPVMLQQLKNAPGFVPVIINIQPMTNLQMWLGLKKNSPSVLS